MAKSLAAGVLLVIAASLFAWIQVTVDSGRAFLLDTSADFLNRSLPVPPVSADTTWVQPFVAQGACLARAEILITTYGSPSLTAAVLRIQGPGAEAQRTAPAGSLADGRFFTLDFPPACESAGQTYALAFSAPDATAQTPISPWTNPDGAPNASPFVAIPSSAPLPSAAEPSAIAAPDDGEPPPAVATFRTYVMAERNLFERLGQDKGGLPGDPVFRFGLLALLTLGTITIVATALSAAPAKE